MKNAYSTSDIQKLNELFINRIEKTHTGNDFISLSGGVDSLTALYAFMECGYDYTVVNFAYNDYPSVDRESVLALQKKIGFKLQTVDVDTQYNDSMLDNIKTARDKCINIYGRVREVKVETIFTLMRLMENLQDGISIYTGGGGDTLVGYHKNDVIKASKEGYTEEVQSNRRISEARSEFCHILNDEKRGIKHIGFFMDEDIQDFILNFDFQACNKKFPKSIYVMPLEKYYKQYGGYRKPKAFQKGGNIKAFFNNLAFSLGYKDALDMFKKL